MDVPVFDSVGRNLYLYGIHEREESQLFQAALRSGDHFLDVGGHCGYFSVLAAAQVGATGRVWALEPNPPLAKLLQSNLDRFPDVPTRVLHACAWKQTTRLSLQLADESDWGESWATPPGSDVTKGDRIAVDGIALDELKDDIGEVRLAKIDAEGAELQVLKGMQEILESEAPPILFLEVLAGCLSRQSHTPTDLYDFLAERGYESFVARSGALVPCPRGTEGTLIVFQNPKNPL